jgi:threonine aldolase
MAINSEFGSDNHSGVHPNIMKAIESVNEGYSVSYGEDDYTKIAIDKFKKFFGKGIDVYFVGNGTAANILGIKTVIHSYHAIYCAETAHLNIHECCGPEKFIGCKLTTIPTKNGKLTVDLIKPYIEGFDDPHMAQPKVISISQPTEYGTVYSPNEIKHIADFAHKNDMFLHIDGARLSNAAASLNVSFADMTSRIGVDILSFGGTKNGMMFGDAIIFFDKSLSKDFKYVRKQGMHLTSKMRYISAQFDALLSNELWLINARHANSMTQLLFNELKHVSGITITQRVDANAIFALLKKQHIKKILESYFFHVFDEKIGEVRWMCSFNTKEKDVLKFVKTIKMIVNS